MFGLGIGEVTIILILALVVLGPKRLPELGKKIGEFYRQFRDTADAVRGTFTGEFEEPKPKSRPVPEETIETKDAVQGIENKEVVARDEKPVTPDDPTHGAN